MSWAPQPERTRSGFTGSAVKERDEAALNIEQHGEELSQADESALHHHYELTYTKPNTKSGRRLAHR